MTLDNDRIAAALATLTAPAEPTDSWRAALESEPAPATVKQRRPRSRQFWHLATAALLVITAAGLFIAMNPSVKSRGSIAGPAPQSTPRMTADYSLTPNAPDFDLESALPEGEGGGAGRSPFLDARDWAQIPNAAADDRFVSIDLRRLQTDLTPRSVAYSASISLRCENIPAALAAASNIPLEARGEFIDRSNYSGGDYATATITLRIDAARLDEVLNQLSKLGEVLSLTRAGEDVTTAIVDTAARLRNEQRIEQELLDLLATRTDAPLEDILKLRRSLGEVRERIEQMTARQQHLARLVSLATIQITLSPPPEEPKEEPKEDASLLTLASTTFSDAWHDGLQGLINAAAAILSFLLRALPALALLALLTPFALRLLRRAWTLTEPAPLKS